VKFSELLGEPEPEPQQPAKASEPISVFAPVPTTPPPASPNVEPPPPPPPPPPTAPITSQVPPPMPSAGRSGLAELNVRQPVTAPSPEPSPLADQLLGLTEVVDDLLPSARRHRK
jgi:hypothetical protein